MQLTRFAVIRMVVMFENDLATVKTLSYLDTYQILENSFGFSKRYRLLCSILNREFRTIGQITKSVSPRFV